MVAEVVELVWEEESVMEEEVVLLVPTGRVRLVWEFDEVAAAEPQAARVMARTEGIRRCLSLID